MTATDVQARPAWRVATARWFYLAASLTVLAVVVYGFGHTVSDSLIKPKIARPPILYIHAAVMSAWVILFVAQVALVRLRRTRWHRRLGIAGLALGAAIPCIGLPTTIVMRRFDIDHLHDTLPFIAVPFGDLVMFLGFFVPAALLRQRPEWHRRLMFLATCVLINAGLGRFPLPDAWFDAGWMYFAIDGLALAGAAVDLVTRSRPHSVYVIGLPLLAVCQLGVWLLWHDPPAAWLAMMRSIVGAG
jgi:hypothetical protein